jgi:DNA gyrase subunit A
MLITTKGQMVRTRVKEIRETGRNAMGVKLMDLRNPEKLQAIAPVVSQTDEETPETDDAPVAEKKEAEPTPGSGKAKKK